MIAQMWFSFLGFTKHFESVAFVLLNQICETVSHFFHHFFFHQTPSFLFVGLQLYVY